MANDRLISVTPIELSTLPPPPDVPGQIIEQLLQSQQSALEALLSWQRWQWALQQELCDQWICRWAGGAPLDG